MAAKVIKPQKILSENNLFSKICSCNKGLSRFFSTIINVMKDTIAIKNPNKIIGLVKPTSCP